MAYAGRMPDRNKALTVLTVAGLHGMVLYGLVTGLGVQYVQDAVTVLKGYNEPIATPPPPPETPPLEPVATRDTNTAFTTRPDVAPTPFVTRDPITLPLRPSDSFLTDPLPGPTVSPPPEKPIAVPTSVRPRGDPGSWVTTDDYPAAALRRGEHGTVRFQLRIGTDGRVTGCQVTASSGSSELDAATCKHVSRRARFEAATDGAGARVPGTYAGSIRWVIPQD